MSMADNEILEKIRLLLSQQRLAVLSTQSDGQPYSSLMAFAFTPDLRKLLVATARATRKHQNIVGESRVSLLVDNRSNSDADFQHAAALTVLGTAEEVQAGEHREYSRLYLTRHPYLEEFLSSPTTSFFQITVDRYLLVSEFEKVMEYQFAGRSARLS